MTIISLQSLLLGYNLIITGIIAALLGISIYNLLRFARLPPAMVRATGPSVSILVPARNEERCIEACVRSVCEQSYDKTDVYVLNDGSTDQTAPILDRLRKEFGHLHVINGAPLPEDWVGKSWACHQLSEVAKGEILIFTDADTVHQTDMVSRSLLFIEQNDVAFFSLIPYQELGTMGENIVIPMIHFLYFAYLPNDLILHNRSVSIAAANGQFMCFTRPGYDKVGGHRSVKGSLVEDVFLAKATKRAGLRIALVDGTDVVSCRMYTSASEVTKGFSKNFFPATNYNLPLTVLFLFHLTSAYIIPIPMVVLGMTLGQPRIIFMAALQLIMSGIIRLLISFRFAMPWWHVFLQPLTGIWSVIIGINSIRWAFSKRGAQWKGRHYATRGTTNA
ncbi:MAG: glycosyltransferase family 2 protein [Candidatus Kapabacteria bacterium]|nr:glycosyltransferase family 2 protein [Candidatus Kapabacteria bacterium]